MNIDIKLSKRRVSYKKAMNFLEKRVKDIKEKKKRELLWVLEHPTTYTAGIRFTEKGRSSSPQYSRYKRITIGIRRFTMVKCNDD